MQMTFVYLFIYQKKINVLRRIQMKKFSKKVRLINLWTIATLICSIPFTCQAQLHINEIMSANESAFADEMGEYDDWLEIYNSGTTEIQIAGMYFSDESANLKKWQIPNIQPDKTLITPGDFLVLWFDNDPEQGVLHADFKLNRYGETIFFTDKDGETIVDEINYPIQFTNISSGHNPDGDDAWYFLSIATPGESNMNASISDNLVDFSIVLNEINYNSDDRLVYGDWIELYNCSEEPVSLSGWHFKDSDDQHDFVLPDITMQPYTYMVLAEENSNFTRTFPNVHNVITGFSFGLSGGGDHLRLFNANNILVDEVEYDDKAPWPIEPDGNGPTLELIDPFSDNTRPENWQASAWHGTPGRDNSRPQFLGDTNGDELVNLTDAIMAMQIVSSHEIEYINLDADVSGNHRIGLDEAIYVLKAIASGQAKSEHALAENMSVYHDDTVEVLKLNIKVSDTEGLSNLLAYRYGDPEPDDITIIFQQLNNDMVMYENKGKMRLRGQSTRGAFQKSFKIRLEQEEDGWRGQWNLNFNKHPWDLTRIRNKISFDLMKSIPYITSLRTQFVHLIINNQSFGLYTFIENASEQFLDSHGLDPNGYLYKAQIFYFSTYNLETLLNNPNQFFTQMLEIKGRSENHSRMIQLLQDINDWSIDINTTIARHFDRNNYLTWLAINILTSNLDTNTQNFYLYSPRLSKKWYFLPWDYDGGWDFYSQPNEYDNYKYRMRNRQGLSNWWNVILHQRFFQNSQNLADIVEMVDHIRKNYLTDEAIQELANEYYPMIYENYIKKSPDLWSLPVVVDYEDNDAAFIQATLEEYNTEYQRIQQAVSNSYNWFHQSLEWPMPVWLGTVYQTENTLKFKWGQSVDLQGDSVFYDFQIYKEPFTATIDDPGTPNEIFKIHVAERLQELSYEAPKPKEVGAYYWRVVVRSGEGDWQIPSYDFSKSMAYGMGFFRVAEDGSYLDQYGKVIETKN
jgi:spore coat protein H